MKKHILIVGSVVLASSLAFGTAASAATTAPYSKDVSCDATITDQLATVWHASNGTIAFNKISTEHAFAQQVRAKSAQGNYLPYLTVNQGTVSWGNTLSSTYTFEIKPLNSNNCNGFLPGDGNTRLTYSITHN